MFERFTRDARAIVVAARDEAASQGRPRVEAEHLLLALADRGTAGLDRDAIADALHDEQRRSLAAVGVELDAFDLADARPAAATARLPFGTSAKTALERTLRAAVERRDRRIEAPHVLLGLLGAEAGTVPRALALAGLDAEQLVAAAETELR
jgi:ATP-dependent Clp protease ATP-binding subunit ClpA